MKDEKIYQRKGKTMTCIINRSFMHRGKPISITAKEESHCHPIDEFDAQEFGEPIAEARAEHDYWYRKERFLLDKTKGDNAGWQSLEPGTYAFTIDGRPVTCVGPIKWKINYFFKEGPFKKEEPNATLKSLVGKWAIRTKACILINGHKDPSYLLDDDRIQPIFIISADDDIVEYNTPIEWGIYPLERSNYKSSLTGLWLDNNWKEHKKEQ